MPSKVPIFPFRLDPALRARAESMLADFPGSTLNGWLNMMVRQHVDRYEAKKAGVEFQRTEPSKNGPCSCGSGKKFKRCCGR